MIHSEDEEEALQRIFGSSDSESDFEAFVAQNKNKQKAPPERLEELTGEELPVAMKEKARKTKGGRRDLKAQKEVGYEDDKRTPSAVLVETNLKKEGLEVDKENRIEVKVEDSKLISKPVPRRAQFKKRPVKKEEEILGSFMEKGLDKEDVLMMKLAFVKLKGMDDRMVEGMHWAYYPHDILSCVCVCVRACVRA